MRECLAELLRQAVADALHDSAQAVLLSAGKLGAPEADTVKDAGEPTDRFVCVARQKQERVGELHRCEVGRPGDVVSVEQKKQLYKAIADRLAKSPGVRPEDVLINLVEVKKENWSFGKGEAQYAS